MFECKFKFSEEDNVIGTVYTMQKQSKKPFVVLRWLIPILILLNIGLMAWDIADGESITLDIILIVTLVLCMIPIYMTNKLYRFTARKSYQKNLADKDLCSVSMDENTCSVSFYKDGLEVAKELLTWNELTGFVEDETRIVLIFNLKFVVIRKDCFQGELDLFKILLNKKLADKTQNTAK